MNAYWGGLLGISIYSIACTLGVQVENYSYQQKQEKNLHSILFTRIVGNMSDSTHKKSDENQTSKKNRSSPDDDEENQVNKPLLHSQPETEIKQPKKKMPLFKKKEVADKDAAGGGDASMFDITLEELNAIMEVRGKDLMAKLKSDHHGVKGIVEKLKVDGNKGLDSNNEQDLEQRRTAYGRNEIPPKPMKSFLRLCWDAFHQDMLLIILLICAIVSICLSFYKPPKKQGDDQDEANLEWIEGVAILVAVLVVILVTAFNDWRKERQFQGLQNKIEKEQQTSVVRDNRVQQIPVSELVVGDLCFIKYGDLLPADGLIVQSSDLKIDESSITGETDLVQKSEKEDAGLLSGTNVMEGSGRMLVVGVGLNSQVGRIMSLLGAAGGDSKKGKKDKKDKKKDKKKDQKDTKKKAKKPKLKSSTKVSPDTSKPDENDDHNQTVHTENEVQLHPRIRKLPALQRASNDDQEMKPTNDKNKQDEKKKSTSNEDDKNQNEKKSKTTEEQKKSSSNQSNNNKTDKKLDDTEGQKKKPVKPPTDDQQNEKKSSSSESSDDEEKKKQADALQKKKSSSSGSSGDKDQKKSNDNEAQKKKSTTPEEKEKRSSSNEGGDNEEEKKRGEELQKKKSSSSGSSKNEPEEQKKKSPKPEQKEKKSSSSESGDENEEEKKKSSSSGSSGDKDQKKSNDDEAQKKKSTKPEGKEKRSSSNEGGDNEEEKKRGEELQKKKSSSSGSSKNEPEEQKKKSPKPEQQEKKSSSSESGNENEEEKKKKKKSSSSGSSGNKSEKKSDNMEEQKKKKIKPKQKEKKSSSSESSDDEEEKKRGEELQKKKSSSSGSSKNEPDEQKKKKTTTTTKSTKPAGNNERKKKESSSDESSDEEQQEKKTEVKKQKQGSDKKGSKKTDDNNQDQKGDSDKKPAGLAALAEDADDDEEGGSKDSKHKSVLQEKLTRLALYIGYIGMSAAALTLICLIIRFCIKNYVIEKNAADAGDVSYFISFLIQAITVIVVAVPEGLPLAVTLALAYAVRKMMTDNNLVRHLDACETMGNASTICSDKTGTLTTNRMTVVQCYIAGKHYDKLPKGEEINKDLSPVLFEAITVNSNYTSKIEEAKKDEGGLPKQVGNKTECALLDLTQKWGGSYDDIRQQYPEDKLEKVYTFNSARKMMSTIIEREDGHRVYTKGASEMVLTKCKSIIGEDNKPKDLNDDEKKKIGHDVIEKMANDGLRTICVAYRDLGKEGQNWDDEEKIIKDLICIAIVGIEDPVRDEVPEAIEKCQKAGVVVRMVTGDNIMTARSIATKCGIIKPEDDFLVLDGKDFNKRIRDSSGKISQKKLDEVWPKLRVLARSSPTDKYNLVNGIVESRATEHREVVAVTGDGTNDGPALKRADVGFAMGIQGTDVAKQASDIILTDDNFSSIVKAMMWGRNVYDCIAKFLQFQLTANLSAGLLSVVSAAAISSVPLRAVQMLWVNLVMDTLASLALATEPPTEALLERKPYGRTKSIISPLMLRNIIFQSAYQLVIMFIILYAGQYFLGVDSTVDAIQDKPDSGRELSAQFTMVFNAFVLMTLFNEINSRKLHGERNVFAGIHRNPFFYCIWIGCFIAQILIVTFGDRVFSCARLDIKQWAWCLLFGVGSLIWQQIILFIPIKPLTKCFSAMYRCCCPCIYKRQKKKEEEEERGDDDQESGKKRKPKKKDEEEEEDQKSDDEKKEKRISKKKQEGDNDDEDDEETKGFAPGKAFGKYSTIAQLTNATVVVRPPPIFARYMLRRSVNQLSAEFRVINEFRSRLESVKSNQRGEATAYKRTTSRDDDLEEE